ncbi:unnamed protein product, partial [Symbiodinium microadriaticum]
MFNGENRTTNARITYSIKVPEKSDDKSEDENEVKFDSISFEVFNSDGMVIRTIKRKAPEKSGMQIFEWGMEEKGIQRIRREGELSKNEPGGIDVLPGTYKVRFTYGDQMDSTQVEVKYDPRLELSDADIQGRYDALKSLESSGQKILTAVEQLKESLKIAGEFEKRMKDQDEEGFKENLEVTKNVKDTLNKMLDIFFGAEDDRQGITRNQPQTVNNYYQTANFYTRNGLHTPTRTETELKEKFESELEKALETVNGYYEEEWPAYQSSMAWLDAQVAGDFHMITPMDTSRADVRTEVRMTYDDKNIYLIAVCYYWNDGPNFVESLRRDWNFGRNDNFIYAMDTYDDQTNGYTFGTNAAGAQWDGTLFEGNRTDLSWDNKWTSAVQNYDDRYVFEMALPFKTIRYKEGITEWGINFSRNDLKSTEKSGWAPVPRQFPSISLAYTGVLKWDEPPPVPKTNVSLIPYTLGRVVKDYDEGTDPDADWEIGGDAKVSITSAMNLDLTVNPDFSQVDVDQQVTNLDRFELFFPERRQFFLENADLFANFGYRDIRPFFSRRIGLNAPIQFGARLSGKLNRDWRIGAMDMQT